MEGTMPDQCGRVFRLKRPLSTAVTTRTLASISLCSACDRRFFWEMQSYRLVLCILTVYSCHLYLLGMSQTTHFKKWSQAWVSPTKSFFLGGWDRPSNDSSSWSQMISAHNPKLDNTPRNSPAGKQNKTKQHRVPQTPRISDNTMVRKKAEN